jgi:iron uptake system EfeUOB component EfeO/EfeM
MCGATFMTRFKELARIQAAIKHRNESELQWAVEYCQMRLRIATRKDHTKHWRSIEREVKDALRTLAAPTP